MPTIETLRAIAAAFNAHDIEAILGFFADLRSGEGPSFVGVLHQQLRSNVLDPAELGDADIDLDDSAWDDDEDGDS